MRRGHRKWRKIPIMHNWIPKDEPDVPDVPDDPIPLYPVTLYITGGEWYSDNTYKSVEFQALDSNGVRVYDFRTDNGGVKGNDIQYTNNTSEKCNWVAVKQFQNVSEFYTFLLETGMVAIPADMAEVFSEWTRFSHDYTDIQPAIPEEVDAWVYDEVENAVVCTVNTQSYVGFISPNAYDNYILEVQLKFIPKVSNDDDDHGGIVIAWYVDPDTGKEHTLSIIRSPDGVNYNLNPPGLRSVRWFCIYDFKPAILVPDAGGHGFNTENIIVNKTNEVGSFGNWTDLGDGVKLYVRRLGDTFICKTTEFNAMGDGYVESATITIDLNSDPRLHKFKGPKPIGFSACSQANIGILNVTPTFEDIPLEHTVYGIDFSDSEVPFGGGGEWCNNPVKNP